MIVLAEKTICYEIRSIYLVKSLSLSSQIFLFENLHIWTSGRYHPNQAV